MLVIEIGKDLGERIDIKIKKAKFLKAAERVSLIKNFTFFILYPARNLQMAFLFCLRELLLIFLIYRF